MGENIEWQRGYAAGYNRKNMGLLAEVAKLRAALAKIACISITYDSVATIALDALDNALEAAEVKDDQN